MTEPMNPADVPDALIKAAEQALAAAEAGISTTEAARSILAAVLPLHALQLGAKLGALTFSCPHHPTPRQFDPKCISCNRYSALVGARRLIEGRDRSAEAVRQVRADTKPAFIITTDDTLSEADAEQLLADLEIIPRPERPADAGWGPGDFVDYIPEDGPEVHALPELDGIYDEDGH